MQFKKYLLLLLAATVLFSCQREDLIPLPEAPQPFTENAFKYDLMPGIVMPDSSQAKQLLNVTSDKLLFQSASTFAASLEPGDILFIPSAVDTFHLTKMAFRVMSKEEVSGGIEIEYAEPLLKEVYEYFSLEVNNQNDVIFRDTVVDWSTLTQDVLDELKVLDLTLINLEIPAGPNTVITWKLGSLTAKMDFQYRFQTEYDGAQNALYNFELGLKNIQIKDFAFSSELEVKRNNMSSPNDVGVSFAGTSLGNVSLIRLPTPVLQGFGIPLVLNIDVGETFEMGLAGKATFEVNFGTWTFTGDPFVIRYDFFTLEDALWTAATTSFGQPAMGAIVSQLDNISIVSYPQSYTTTNSICPIKFTPEMAGFIKPSLAFGVSLSPPAYSSLAIGIYMDIYLEAVGKVTADVCLNQQGITFTPGACFEVNAGLKLPYIMATKAAPGLDIFSYDNFKLAFLGEVKNNIFKFPADCNPFDSIGFVTPGIVVTPSCTGDRPFVYVNVVPPTLITGSSFNLMLGNQTISNLSYNQLVTLYFDEHGLGNIDITQPLQFAIKDIQTNATIGVGSIDVPGCTVAGCTTISDDNLPTYGEKFYCEFLPDLPGYNERWIKDNMFYTSRPDNIGFDPLTDGRCYNDDVENCASFGRYYTWHAATGPRRNLPGGPWAGEDICPLGYHIPSKAEWELLIEAAGGPFGNVVLSEEGWPGLYDESRNLSGFSAFPYGIFVPGSNGGSSAYQGFSEIAAFWTSTEAGAANGDSFAYAVYISTDKGIEIKPTVKNMGIQCRCIKD